MHFVDMELHGLGVVEGVKVQVELVFLKEVGGVLELGLEVVDEDGRGRRVLAVLYLGVDDAFFEDLGKLELEVLVVDLLHLVKRHCLLA